MSFRQITLCQRGTAAIEFAIVSGLLIMLIVGGIDVGRALYVKNQLSFLADEAARDVMFEPYVSEAEIISRLSSDFSAGDAAQLSLSMSYQVFANVDFRVIEIAYPMDTFIPYLTSPTLTLRVSRRIPMI